MKFRKYKLIGKWPYLVAFWGLSLLAPGRAQALIFTSLVEDIVALIWGVILHPVIFVLWLELGLLKIIASYNNFTNEGGVILGWIALRDLSNMFFILILLIIAFATILRVSSYGYQQLLRRTLIIAILINFSKTIVGFVIDISQVVMLTFVAATNEVITGGIVVAFGLKDLFTINNIQGSIPMEDYIIAVVLGTVFMIVLVVVMGVMIMMLLGRIVALWVAIILAPLAFLASIFPATSSFYNTWVKQLGSNLVTGPILAFFLWLTLNIVANGNAYTSFMDDQSTEGAITFLSSSNMVNYIVAITLLLIGIKTAASSGSAGANIASKAMSKIESTTSKLARRYPMALGQRVGARAASVVIDSEGASKRGFQKLTRVPFYGGRLQRGAQQMKGVNAARIMAEKAEDEKNLLPQHKVAFQKSYAQGAANESKLGRLYSKIGSWGGDTEREAMMYQNILARGEINAATATAATNSLRNIGDEEGMQRIQAEYWTFKDQKEANRIIEKQGLNGLLTRVKTANLQEKVVDKDGNPVMEKYIDPEDGILKEKQKVKAKQSTIYGLDALTNPEHGQADHNGIASKILGWSKEDRWRFMDIIKNDYDFNERFTNAPALETEGGYEQDKRNFVVSNLGNSAVMWSQVQAKIYAQKMGSEFDAEGNIINFGADRYYHAAGRRDLNNSFVKAGQVADRLQQWHGETDNQFKKRQQHARALDNVNLKDSESLPWAKDSDDEEIKKLRKKFIITEAGQEKIDQKAFNKYRQKSYRQILGLDAYTDNLQGKKRSDYHNNDHIYDSNLSIDEKAELVTRKWVSPEAIRNDLARQDSNPAKEGQVDYDIRKASRGNFASQEEFDNYELNLANTKRRVKKILSLKMEDLDKNFDEHYGEGAFEAEKRRMVAEVVGDKRTAHDLVSKSIWGEAQDGADGTRLAEVNTGDENEVVMLDHALDSSENKQQAQAFQVSTPQQTQYIVDKLAELGKQPQKILLENIPKALAAASMQKLNDIKAMQAGKLPQDLSLLGADVRKLSVVLKTIANLQGKTVKQLLASKESGGDPALKDYVENLQKMHKSNPNIDINNFVIDDAPVGQNSQALQDIIDATGYEVQTGDYSVKGGYVPKSKAKLLEEEDEEKKKKKKKKAREEEDTTETTT